MENTYIPTEERKNERLNFEEKLIPEDMEENIHHSSNCTKCKEKSKKPASDDLFLILILLLLIKEDSEDSGFLFVLLLIIFGK